MKLFIISLITLKIIQTKNSLYKMVIQKPVLHQCQAYNVKKKALIN